MRTEHFIGTKHLSSFALFSSDEWLNNLFDLDQREPGNVVRRKVSLVARMASHEQLVAAVMMRGYHLLQMGGDYVILCGDDETMRLVC